MDGMRNGAIRAGTPHPGPGRRHMSPMPAHPGRQVSGYTDRVAAELLALVAPDPAYPRIDREYVRNMLAEAWTLGYSAAAEHYEGGPLLPPLLPPLNPFMAG